MRFGRALVEGRPRVLVSIDGTLRDLAVLPGRSSATDGLDVITSPVSADELAALAAAPVVPEPEVWLPPIERPPKNILCVGRNYGARGLGLFRKIILPGALPAIFTGLRLGLGLALITVIVVEFVTAKSGLGHLVFRSWQMLLTAEMFAAFVLIGLIGLALTRGLRLLQQRALAWTPPERELT